MRHTHPSRCEPASISPRRHPQRPPDHVDERARIVVPEIERDRRDRRDVGNPFQRPQQPGLLTRLRERQPRLGDEAAIRRPRADAGPSLQLPAVHEVLGQRVDDLHGPLVLRLRAPQHPGSCEVSPTSMLH